MAAIYHDEKGEIGGGIAGVSVAEESGIWMGEFEANAEKKEKNKKSLENYGRANVDEKKEIRLFFQSVEVVTRLWFWRVSCNE